MKRVQEALVPTGIPAFVGIWTPTATHAQPPDQYMVYSTMTVEDEHADDEVTRYKTFVYLNLWSRTDVTEAIQKVRRAMRAAGFAMEEETDRGYSQPAYSTDADLFTVAWTWVCWEAVSDGV